MLIKIVMPPMNAVAATEILTQRISFANFKIIHFVAAVKYLGGCVKRRKFILDGMATFRFIVEMTAWDVGNWIFIMYHSPLINIFVHQIRKFLIPRSWLTKSEHY